MVTFGDIFKEVKNLSILIEMNFDFEKPNSHDKGWVVGLDMGNKHYLFLLADEKVFIVFYKSCF